MSIFKNPIVIVGGLGALLAIIIMSKGSGGATGANVTLASEKISADANAQAMNYQTQQAIAAMQEAHANAVTDTGFNVAVLQTIQAQNTANAVVQLHYDQSRAGITALAMQEKTNLALANLDASTRLALAPIQASTYLSAARISADTATELMSIQAASNQTLAEINANAAIARANVAAGGSSNSSVNDASSALGMVGEVAGLAAMFF